VPLTALGVRLAWRYLQGEGIVPQPDPRQPGQLRVGTTTLPPLEPNAGSYVQADTRGYQILLDYQGLKPHPAFVSLTAVLSDAVDPRIFQDKVVLIGVMAESVPDLFQTPLSRGRRSHRMSHGVELHAQLASQLMRAGTDGQAPLTTLAEWQEVSWILLWGVLGSLSSVWVRSPWHSGLISLSAVALLGLLVLGLFFLRRWLPLLPPVLAWGLCSTVMTAYVAHQERQTRHLITQLFMSQVPPEIVNLLWERRQELLDGRRLQPCSLTATVLFVDLKGYTPIAENMAPQALMRWLNIYLDRTGICIFCLCPG